MSCHPSSAHRGPVAIVRAAWLAWKTQRSPRSAQANYLYFYLIIMTKIYYIMNDKTPPEHFCMYVYVYYKLKWKNNKKIQYKKKLRWQRITL